jgi:hypothetical protein
MIFRGNQVQRIFNPGFFIPDDTGHFRIIFHQIWHDLPSRNLFNLLKALSFIRDLGFYSTPGIME